MKLGDILKGAASVAAAFVPGGREILTLVNGFLPADKRLPDTATGSEVESAIATLPADQQAVILAKEIDLQIAQEEGWTERYNAMVAADGHSTRPQIALKMANIMAFAIISMTLLLVYMGYTNGPESISQPYLWTVFASLTAVPAGVLAKYFGELRREHKERQATISGKDPSSALGDLIKAFRG